MNRKHNSTTDRKHHKKQDAHNWTLQKQQALMCLFSKMKKTYASSGAQRSGAQTVERTTNMKPDNAQKQFQDEKINLALKLFFKLIKICVENGISAVPNKANKWIHNP